jgi:hypothetical protein
MAGCPRCAIDLVDANPHKPAQHLANGYRTFKELRVGEILNLPDKWFDGRHDALPPSYFKALASPDGVTHGVGGVPEDVGLGMACRPAPRMATVSDSLADWNGGGTLRDASSETESKLNLGAVFVGGLLIASAIGGAVAVKQGRV